MHAEHKNSLYEKRCESEQGVQHGKFMYIYIYILTYILYINYNIYSVYTCVNTKWRIV